MEKQQLTLNACGTTADLIQKNEVCFAASGSLARRPGGALLAASDAFTQRKHGKFPITFKGVTKGKGHSGVENRLAVMKRAECLFFLLIAVKRLISPP